MMSKIMFEPGLENRGQTEYIIQQVVCFRRIEKRLHKLGIKHEEES